VLDKYWVDWVIVAVGTSLSRTLAKQPAWREVYLDAKVAIFVR